MCSFCKGCEDSIVSIGLFCVEKKGFISKCTEISVDSIDFFLYVTHFVQVVNSKVFKRKVILSLQSFLNISNSLINKVEFVWLCTWFLIG